MPANKAFCEILATFDVLETFELLPQADQERFSRWIENSTEEGSRLRRLEAFVLALRTGPLQPAGRESRSSVG